MKSRYYIGVAIMLTFSLPGQELRNPKVLRAALSSGRPPEVPVLATKWIQDAPAAERESATTNAVQAALEINPAAAALVVGAISRAFPETAALAAATAATQQPAQADAIAKAAVAIAPAMVGKIVAAVCKAVPERYLSVAAAVSEAAPNAGKDILESVGAVIPVLRQRLDQEIANYGLVPPPVAFVLERVSVIPQEVGLNGQSSQTARPTLLGGPISANASTNGVEHGHHGGRNYAKP